MNVTLLTAIGAVILWLVLWIVLAIPAGWVHLCYALAMVLFARRVLVGAPRFRS